MLAAQGPDGPGRSAPGGRAQAVGPGTSAPGVPERPIRWAGEERGTEGADGVAWGWGRGGRGRPDRWRGRRIRSPTGRVGGVAAPGLVRALGSSTGV